MPRENRIDEFADKLAAVVREAELEGAKLVAESAKARVPVDTGALRDAIHTQEAEDGVRVVAGDKEVFYAGWVEHGTVHAAPHPFLVPALEENTEQIVGLLRDAARRAAG